MVSAVSTVATNALGALFIASATGGRAEVGGVVLLCGGTGGTCLGGGVLQPRAQPGNPTSTAPIHHIRFMASLRMRTAAEA